MYLHVIFFIINILLCELSTDIWIWCCHLCAWLFVRRDQARFTFGFAYGPQHWALSVGTGQGSLFCIWAALRFGCGDLARFKLWSACGRQPWALDVGSGQGLFCRCICFTRFLVGRKEIAIHFLIFCRAVSTSRSRGNHGWRFTARIHVFLTAAPDLACRDG